MVLNDDNLNKEETIDGTKWVFPKCVKCKFSDGIFCKKYKGEKLELSVDLMECPGFEEEKEVK